jgi:hypothetical protein
MLTYEAEENARRQGGDGAADRKERGHLWMARNDLRGYLLLGDPAVRLPLSQLTVPTTETSPQAGSASTTALLEAPSRLTPELGPRPADSATIATDTKVAAVHALLRGNEPPRDIAERAGASLDEVWSWFDAYRSAGRGALGR